MLSHRAKISLAVGSTLALFAAMVAVNARLSWRPVSVDFLSGLPTPAHVPIAWHGDELWFLSPFYGVPLINSGTPNFLQPNLRHKARNWNRAALPLVISQSLQNSLEGVGAFCAPHDLFACTSNSGAIQIWRNKKLERTVKELGRVAPEPNVFEPPPDLLSFSPDGKYLASSSELKDKGLNDCRLGLVLFDVSNGRQIARQSAFEGAFSDVKWSPDSREVAGITLDGWVFVLDARSGKLKFKFHAHQLFAAQIVWSPDGKTLVTATNPRFSLAPKNIKFDLKSGGDFMMSHGQGSATIGLVSGKPRLVIATDARGITTWNGRTERLLKRFDARTGKQIGQALPLETGAVDMAFSPDGRQLALGEHEFALLLNSQTLATERRLNIPPPTAPNSVPAPVCVAWSGDGATLATSTQRGLTLWRMH